MICWLTRAAGIGTPSRSARSRMRRRSFERQVDREGDRRAVGVDEGVALVADERSAGGAMRRRPRRPRPRSMPARSARTSASLTLLLMAKMSALTASFSAAPEPSGPTWVTCFATRSSAGPRPLEVVRRAARHDRELARVGQGRAAGDRRVEDAGAALAHGRLERGDRVGRHGAHVDEHAALVRPGHEPGRSIPHGAHRVAVGEHADRHVGFCGCLGGGGRHARAQLGGERLRRLERAVVDGQRRRRRGPGSAPWPIPSARSR